MDKVVVSNTKNMNAAAVTFIIGAAITTNTGASELKHLGYWLLPVSAQVPVQESSIEDQASVTNLMPTIQEKSVVFVPDVIARANEVIGIGKQHIASIFGISRQHLYNIVNDPNTAVKPDNQARAARVDEALTAIRSVTRQKLGASTMTFRIDNVRLLDLLQDDQIDLDQVKLFALQINSRIVSQLGASSLPDSIADQQEYLDTPDAI